MKTKYYSFRGIITIVLIPCSVITHASLLSLYEIQSNDTITLSPGHNAVWSFTSTDGSAQNGMTTINYYDDFGRIEETIQAGKTPSGTDLVSLNEYNAKGQLWRQWLDGESEGINKGSFVSNQDSKLASIASNSDNAPYSLYLYEASPLNRLITQYGPGNNWHVNDKRNETSYQVSVQGTSNYACKTFNLSTSGYNVNIYCNGTMRTGALDVTCSKDEDDREIYEFKDKRGWLMLNRQKISTNSFADTYYLYDNMGKLRAVLPPAVSDNIQLYNSISTDLINQYAYLYLYDNRERLIAKKLPGCDWNRFAYDGADRILYSQDGEQRQRGELTFYLYDIFGRLCVQGIADGNVSDNSSITSIPCCTFNGSSDQWKGYSITGVQLSNVKLGIVNYYDNYNFTSLLPSSSLPNSSPYFGNSAISVTGNLTGMVVARMDSAYMSTFDYSILRYDNRGRLIHKESTNILGGYDTEDISLNHLGLPIVKRLFHHVQGKMEITQQYVYSYDHAMRLVTLTHKINESPEVELELNQYDELGRLITKQQNDVNVLPTSSLLTSYEYNLRNWPTKIENQLFTENIYYNESHNGNTPQYGGNISEINWKVGMGSNSLNRGYTYLYDWASRLIQADYIEGGEANSKYDTQYTYDLMGNMLALERNGKKNNGNYGLIDDLSFTYNGNQVTKIVDSAIDPNYTGAFNFADGSNMNIEYEYNNNGCMTKDLNKNISSIQYNLLYLPSMIKFKNSAKQKNIYSADGQKIRSEHDVPTITVIEVPSMGGGSIYNPITIWDVSVTSYCGNIIYENGALSKLLIDGGYVTFNGSTPLYNYYLNDHLGNVRVVIDESGFTEQVNHYYPFGGLMGESTNGDTQRYKFNGKELDRVSGLDWYDYGARQYDGMRFTTMDPLAEKYYSISPYAYCANNPVNAIDPDGRSIYMLFYTTGNGENDDNMFKVAAETRMRDIMNGKGYDSSKDIVILQSVSDLGEIGSLVNNIVGKHSEKYGKTAEFDFWSHSGLDGPIGTSPTSNNALDDLQMTIQGWSNIDFNWEKKASAYFYGCRSGVSADGYASFTTELSARKNFHNVNIYGQNSYSYPSKYTNRRESTLGILNGDFSYPTYMVGGNKGEGLQAFYHGIPAPSMRRSYNGRGYLGNYYQPGKRY